VQGQYRIFLCFLANPEMEQYKEKGTYIMLSWSFKLQLVSPCLHMFSINFIGFLVAVGASSRWLSALPFFSWKGFKGTYQTSIGFGEGAGENVCGWGIILILSLMLFPALDNLCYIKPPFLRFLLEHVARMSPELNLLCWTFLPQTNQAQVCKLTDFFMTGSSDPYWYCVSFCICHPWLGKICTPKERGTLTWRLPKDRLVWCIMSALTDLHDVWWSYCMQPVHTLSF